MDKITVKGEPQTLNLIIGMINAIRSQKADIVYFYKGEKNIIGYVVSENYFKNVTIKRRFGKKMYKKASSFKGCTLKQEYLGEKI